MTADSGQPAGVRASDAERAQYADTVQAASRDGRLDLTETEQRLTQIYAATYRHELRELVRDLPEEDWPAPVAPRAGQPVPRPPQAAQPRVWNGALTAHVAIVSLIAVLAVAGWIRSGVPFFWPAWPIGWLGITVLVHYRITRRRQYWRENGRWGGPWDRRDRFGPEDRPSARW